MGILNHRIMIPVWTERLVIRDLAPEDAGNILLLNSDPEVLRYVGDSPFTDIDAARLWISGYKSHLPHGFGRWSVELADGRWIGRCSLRHHANGETEMGYRLLREHWGMGYATELVRALIGLGSRCFGVSTFLIKVAPKNAASIRVAEKCGARFWKEGPCERSAEALIYRIDMAEG